jgi:hypothetical protein
MTGLRHIILVSVLLNLTACAAFKIYPNCDVPVDTGIPILHPAALNANLVANQQVRISTKDDQFEFLSQIEVNNDKLILVALTPIGQKLFQIQYTQGKIQFERFGIPDSFNPAYLLADISVIYSEVRELNSCYQLSGISAKAIDNSTLQRTIYYPGHKEINISYSSDNNWTSNILFTNPVRHYTISIKSLSVEHL